MTTPFVTNIRKTEAPKPASDRSLSYLRDLMLDKAAHLGDTREGAQAKIDEWFAQGPSQKQASESIDRLKGEGYTGRSHQFEQAEAQPSGELEDGFYELTDGRILKIVHAVHGSGNQYGKVLDTETGKFDYISGGARLVRETGTKLTLERARELGHLYGMCIRCGATLTDEDSIAAGIGPVCATKF